MTKNCIGYEIEMSTVHKEFIKFGYEMKIEKRKKDLATGLVIEEQKITLIKFNHLIIFERIFDKKRGFIFTCIKNQLLEIKGGDENDKYKKRKRVFIEIDSRFVEQFELQ